MPERNERTHMSNARKQKPTSPAAALIAAAEQLRGNIRIPAEAVEALRALVAHNDQFMRQNSRGRVSAGTAITMLRESYGVQLSTSSVRVLDEICRRDLGRKSWGTP